MRSDPLGLQCPAIRSSCPSARRSAVVAIAELIGPFERAKGGITVPCKRLRVAGPVPVFAEGDNEHGRRRLRTVVADDNLLGHPVSDTTPNLDGEDILWQTRAERVTPGPIDRQVCDPVVALDVRGGVAPGSFAIDEQTILGETP